MISWVIIFCCWVVSFVYAGIEAGLLSLDQVRLRHQVKLRNRSAMLLDRLQKKPERLLVTILLVTNLADITGLLLLTRRLVRLLGGWGYPVALLLAGPIYLFMLGVLPKSLFRRFPYRALAALAGLLEFTSRLFWPLLELGALFGRLWLRKKNATPRMFAAREDLKQLTVESELQGALTSAERAMIHNVVDFRTVKVSDVMQPLRKVVAVKPDTSVAELLQLSAKTGVDRVPIISKGVALTVWSTSSMSSSIRDRGERCVITVAGSSPRRKTNRLIASSGVCARRGSPSRRWSIGGASSPASSPSKISLGDWCRAPEALRRGCGCVPLGGTRVRCGQRRRSHADSRFAERILRVERIPL